MVYFVLFSQCSGIGFAHSKSRLRPVGLVGQAPPVSVRRYVHSVCAFCRRWEILLPRHQVGGSLRVWSYQKNGRCLQAWRVRVYGRTKMSCSGGGSPRHLRNRDPYLWGQMRLFAFKAVWSHFAQETGKILARRVARWAGWVRGRAGNSVPCPQCSNSISSLGLTSLSASDPENAQKMTAVKCIFKVKLPVQVGEGCGVHPRGSILTS